MKALIRPIFAVAVASLLAVSLLGLRSACDPAGLRILLQEGRRGEQLQQGLREQSRFCESTEHIVGELIAQRCSLSEAIARWEKLDSDRFQKMEREQPDLTTQISKMYYLLRSDADCYYRLIAKLAAAILYDRPEESAAVLRRLEKDYQQLRANRQAYSSAPIEQTGPNR